MHRRWQTVLAVVVLACGLGLASAFVPARLTVPGLPRVSRVRELPMSLATRCVMPGADENVNPADRVARLERRWALLSLASLAAPQMLSLAPSAVFAEDTAATAASGEEAVCNNPLGCKIPEKLAPPKKIFKDIFEEERELARQREEIAEKARAQQRTEVLKLIAANFEALQKGRDDLAREVGEAVTKVEENPEDAAAWDDIRKVERMSRLYDTALRKDGMYPAADRIKKAKIEFDRNTSDSICKNLNAALKALDAAGKKKDAVAARTKFDESLAAMDSWLALKPTA